jgi:hypothetical protein
MSLSMPRGPRVVRTVSVSAMHALMLLISCGLPWLVSVPSLSRMICGCCGERGGYDRGHEAYATGLGCCGRGELQGARENDLRGLRQLSRRTIMPGIILAMSAGVCAPLAVGGTAERTSDRFSLCWGAFHELVALHVFFTCVKVLRTGA